MVLKKSGLNDAEIFKYLTMIQTEERFAKPEKVMEAAEDIIQNYDTSTIE